MTELTNSRAKQIANRIALHAVESLNVADYTTDDLFNDADAFALVQEHYDAVIEQLKKRSGILALLSLENREDALRMIPQRDSVVVTESPVDPPKAAPPKPTREQAKAAARAFKDTQHPIKILKSDDVDSILDKIRDALKEVDGHPIDADADVIAYIRHWESTTGA